MSLSFYKEPGDISDYTRFWNGLHSIYTSIDFFSSLCGNFKVISRTKCICIPPSTQSHWQIKNYQMVPYFVRNLNGIKKTSKCLCNCTRDWTGEHLSGPNGLQIPIYPSGRIATDVSVLEKMSQCPFGGWVVQNECNAPLPGNSQYFYNFEARYCLLGFIFTHVDNLWRD